MRYVVDTSVAVKWLDSEREEHVAQAKDLLALAISGQAELFTPDLIVYEVLNALVKSKKTPLVKLTIDLNLFLDLPLTLIPSSKELLLQAAKIATEYNLTIYDATFLAVAKTHNAALVTENLKDQGKVKEVRVLNIADFSFS